MTDTTLSGPDVGARVVRGSIIRLAGFVVINLLGAVGVAILQRHLGVATYGEYGTVLALIAIVSTIAGRYSPRRCSNWALPRIAVSGVRRSWATIARMSRCTASCRFRCVISRAIVAPPTIWPV